MKPASKDAGGLVHGTVTDLKDKVSMPFCPLKRFCLSQGQHCCRSPLCGIDLCRAQSMDLCVEGDSMLMFALTASMACSNTIV